MEGLCPCGHEPTGSIVAVSQLVSYDIQGRTWLFLIFILQLRKPPGKTLNQEIDKSGIRIQTRWLRSNDITSQPQRWSRPQSLGQFNLVVNLSPWAVQIFPRSEELTAASGVLMIGRTILYLDCCLLYPFEDARHVPDNVKITYHLCYNSDRSVMNKVFQLTPSQQSILIKSVVMPVVHR